MKKTSLLILLIFNISLAIAQRHSTGLVFDDDKYDSAPVKATLTRGLYVEEIATSNSLKMYCPTPMDQGDFGTCVGWSSNWAARTIIEAMKNGWTDRETINQNAYSPGFIYQMIKDKSDQNCSYGASIFDALNYMKFNGSVKYQDFSSQCATSVESSLQQKAMSHKIKDFARLFGREQSPSIKIETVKKSLSENYPVVFGMKCAPSFYDAKDVWRPSEDPNGSFGGHAMCVIGYDDTKYGGAFEIMNSWGEDWGNDGFIWITYKDFGNFTKYAYEIISEPVKQPIIVAKPQEDFSGQLKLVTDKGKEMEGELMGQYYKLIKSYPSGTSFRIYLSNNEPAYVYAIGTDNTEEIFQLFPYAPEVSAALNYKKNDVALPSEDHYITMDNTVGKDYLCVLYSKDPLDIDQIKASLDRTNGRFMTRLKTVLGSKLISPENVNFNSNEISFKAFSKGGSVVALIVETDHI
ncbi:MAG: cysteine protease [Thalassobius sp.]|nr:cysteine protease [Thalassovita sp.]